MVTAKNAARFLYSKRSKRRRSLTKPAWALGQEFAFCIDYGAPAKWMAATVLFSSSLILGGSWSRLAECKSMRGRVTKPL